LVEIKESN